MDYCGPRGLEWETFLGWSKRSRDAALVWDLRQRQTCGACGTRRAEHTHPRAFVATAVSCPGCAVIEKAKPKFREDQKAGRLAEVARLVLMPNRARE